jgi:hypothetical protein
MELAQYSECIHGKCTKQLTNFIQTVVGVSGVGGVETVTVAKRLVVSAEMVASRLLVVSLRLSVESTETVALSLSVDLVQLWTMQPIRENECH